MNDFTLAMSRCRRKKYKEGLQVVDQILQKNSQDAVYLCNQSKDKCQNYELEMDGENIGDILMQEEQGNHRQGTSFNNNESNVNKMVRPMSKSGRLNSGFQRPGSQLRPDSQSNRLETALKAQRQGTSRPLSQGGRYIRLMTASLQLRNDETLQVDKLNLKAIAKKKIMSKVILNYLLFVDHNPKKALELCIYSDSNWWWKTKQGQCHFLLQQYREANQCYLEAIQLQPMILTYLLLNNIFIKLNQPRSSIELLQTAEKLFKNDTLILATRIYEMLENTEQSISLYKQVLQTDQSNLEAVANLASHYFYLDQPEMALRLYKRLVMLGVHNSEIYNNLALCCYYDGQYDIFTNFFEQALQLAQDDETLSNIWYNISHIFIKSGQVPLGEIALKLSIKYDQLNYETLNNLGVLNARADKDTACKYYYQIAMKEAAYNFEAYYNSSLIFIKNNDLQSAYRNLKKCLNVYPQFYEAQQLMLEIQKQFSSF